MDNSESMAFKAVFAIPILLPAGIYELRVAWFYFRHGKIITPLGYLVMELIYKFLPGTFEEYLDSIEKIFGKPKPRTLAIYSGCLGLVFLFITTLTIVAMFTHYR